MFSLPNPPPKSDFKTHLKDFKGTLELVWRTSPKSVFILVFLSFTQALLPAANLWIAKLLLDTVAEVTTGKTSDMNRLIELLGLQVGTVILGNIIASVQSATRELFADQLQNKISQDLLGKAANLEVEQFENAETYDALQSAYREAGNRPLGVLSQVIALVQALITLGSIGALMSRLGWGILPLVLLSTLPGVWVSTRFGLEDYRMIRRRTHDSRVQNYLGFLLINDTLVKEIRLFHFEPYLLKRWNEYYQQFRNQLVSLIRRRSAWGMLASFISSLLIAASTYLILLKAARHEISVGDFSIFILGLTQVQNQFSGFLSGFSSLYQHLLYMRNLFGFLEITGRDLDDGEAFEGDIETLEFQDVSFCYPMTTKNVLHNISFEVTRGQALALVGENGAGKTTIVKLLTRLFEPTQGKILINGRNATLYSTRSLQKAMSIIFQDFGQYQMTIKENISLSAWNSEQASDSDLLAHAAQTAKAHFIKDLPDEFNTQLGRLFTGGQQLSGGQWQRIALARLYYRKASLLVFDEPTAALDANAEHEVIASLRNETRNRITIIISHRFSTVRLADQILVLEKGRIVERGTHEELIERNGTYAHMYTLQAQGYQ